MTGFARVRTQFAQGEAIFRVSDDGREEVWSYTEERAEEAAAAPRESLAIYGFDVARWTGPLRR